MPFEYRGKQIRSLESDRRFNPAMLSGVELDFVAEHIGQSPAKAMKDGCGGANPTTVRPVLDFFFDLIESDHPGFCGIDEFRERIKPWVKRNELIKQTAPHNNGALLHVELFSKQGSRRVRGGRGSDFGHVRRYAFDFIDDALPTDLEGALAAMTDTAGEALAAEDEKRARIESEARAAEDSGAMSSDRVGPDGLLFDDSTPGRIKCVVPGCGYQKDYNVVEGDETQRRGAMRALYLHANAKFKHDDTDEGHAQVAYGMKQG